MLKKSHPLNRFITNRVKNYFMHFHPDARVVVLSNWHKIQVCDKFSSVIFICLTPFSKLWFGIIGSMILIQEYISLRNAAVKMAK